MKLNYLALMHLEHICCMAVARRIFRRSRMYSMNFFKKNNTKVKTQTKLKGVKTHLLEEFVDSTELVLTSK